MSRIRGTAETVSFEGHENGWHLVVETNAGTFDFNVHGCLLDLERSYKNTIAPYFEEGHKAAATAPTDDDLEGYEPSDPKRIALMRERGEA